jgi:outer membrane receptor protein involved in Fe transport
MIPELHETKPDGTKTTTDSENFLDLAIRQQVAANLSFFFEAQNVLDEDKQDTEIKLNGDVDRKTESPGRTILAGLEMRF